jgi:transcriptional regulator GlxA family with amidase domain
VEGWPYNYERLIAAMHSVAILAIHGVLPFDLSTPCEIFARLRTASGENPYHVRVCGEARDVKAGPFDIRVQWDLSHASDANTIIVPGIANPTMPLADEVLALLREAYANGSRIASICTGAFVLAAAGLLDGKRATTHWIAASELAARYPRIDVDPNALFVDNGCLLTSAGAAAGLDLCLHMIRCDYGTAVAAMAARLAVVPLVREGGQAQFIWHQPVVAGTTLEPLLAWMLENLARPISLTTMADRANMSARTLVRRFREQTGTTPMHWLVGARVRRAQELLETTHMSIDQIASAVGFESAASLRQHFSKIVGLSPRGYRRSFGGDVEVGAP